MAKWKIVNTYKSTAVCYVEADTEKQALKTALGMDDIESHDQSLYDSDAYEISDEEFKDNQ